MLVRADLIHLDGSLAANEVHAWHTDVGGTPTRPLLEILDAAERERVSRFKVSSARDQYVVGHGLLRIALGRYLRVNPPDIRFRAGPHGKPELDGTQNLSFNLSHTDDSVIIAVTRSGAVGVDVERVRKNLDPLDLATRFFSGQETAWLRSQPEPDRFASFFACWTAKEAYIKACGKGLSMGLGDFSLIPDREEMELQIHGGSQNKRQWSAWRLSLAPDLRAALVAEGHNLVPRVGRWSYKAES